MTDIPGLSIGNNTTYENGGETNGQDKGYKIMKTEIFVPTAIGLIILIVIGIGGNVITILAYFEHRQHNKVYDFFIFNLAVTDLIVCSISMPIYGVYTLMEFTWPFGYWFCKIWLLSDFTACTEATALILILSIDRLLMMALRSKYEKQITWKVAKTVLIISWILSFVYYGPAILAWNYLVGYSTVEYMDCDVEFAYENEFVIIMSILDFLVPAVGLAVINGFLLSKIFRWASSKKLNKYPESKAGQCFVLSKQRTLTQMHDSATLNTIKMSVNTSLVMLGPEKDLSYHDQHLKLKAMGTNAMGIKKHSSVQSKLKSAKLLFMLVFSFLFFWAPYTITTVVISTCTECVNTNLYIFFNWLLWMKSAVNPFLYAFHVPRYRQCFKKYMDMYGKCGNIHP